MSSDSPYLRRRPRWLTALLVGSFAVTAGALASTGCAEGTVVEVAPDDDGGSGGAPGTGGNAQTGGNGQGGEGGDPGPCNIDCGSIDTAQCQQAVCNEVTGNCEVVNLETGSPCDDDLFCTIDDTCNNGACVGGPENDCGLPLGPCEVSSCDEMTDQCSPAPGNDGTSCQDPQNLCLVGGNCQNGLCTGGTLNDCFFQPTPECHISVCNPANGMCEPQVGDEGLDCTDENNLCTVQNTCLMGVCQGGVPKDCSQLTMGCNIGTCDNVTGLCAAQAVADGDPCDDLNSCTVGELCGMGQCTGGTAITQCINADGCCPMACTQASDDDCGCNINHASNATPSSNGGGSGGYGPTAWNDGINQAACEASGCSGCFGWISNSTTANGAYMQYDWTSSVQIGSIFVDTNECNVNGCSSNARALAGGEVQYWDGVNWITAYTFSGGTGDVTATFVPKLNTTKLRIFNALSANACGQASNSLIYEWYVWPGSNCTPPP